MKIITIRLTDEQKRLFDNYLNENNIENVSECIRQIIISHIKKDIDDKNLTLQSLSTLHDRITKIHENEEVLLNLILKFYQNLLVYQGDIPEETKEAAVRNAVRKFRKLLEAFKKSLRENPEKFESMLADNIEER
jgi:Arc/MetJ-type ribon-helix-helix transcriptional regulator